MRNTLSGRHFTVLMYVVYHGGMLLLPSRQILCRVVFTVAVKQASCSTDLYFQLSNLVRCKA